ncbi:MAG: cytochrome b/b6 domain-containing protein [Hydrogenophaga sp.]|uniref:cytochrome b/b6 domain-containing protein n=1 Tax=Hydrogenophaga sp. TaxID=1904254 RepID=UPI00276D93AA|nr:cytochrome b/b6 domain-containing protein [Hydrogenophaga sp.]MDP2416388.1 cytochrome b/b6 domain-containing protein [Hydrogenophaga sp.]MDZ4190252.1 cytochrome b/b6 domain-containing protein [Hydrogenophaga sp.]
MNASVATSAGTQARPAAQAVAGPAPSRRVVDAATRMYHGLFALSFLGAYLTAEGERWRMLHVTLGYTLAGLLVFRVVYGLFGPRQARLSALWAKLSGGADWLRSASRARALAGVNWRQGQNLLMALAVVCMLVTVVPVTLTGYASFNEWGPDALTDWHAWVGDAFLVLVLAHLGGLLALSLWRRKNLTTPMLTGRTEGRGPDLVKHNHAALAALLLLAVAAYITWEWSQSPKGLIDWPSLWALFKN